MPQDWQAFFEQRSGVIFPEKVISANLKVAADAGANLHFDETVTGWGKSGAGAFVESEAGRYHADSVILAAGAWMPGLMADLGLPLSVERVSLWMMEPRANRDAFLPENCPNASWEYDGLYPLYMSADFGTGVKLALDHHGTPADPDTLVRETTVEDEENIRTQIRKFVPDLDGRVLSSKVCMYTNTPDLDFVVDRHPEIPQIVIASVCSGHGFKFAPVMGEILADMAVGVQPQFDLEMFSIRRF
jgi:sarcosine oxidase